MYIMKANVKDKIQIHLFSASTIARGKWKTSIPDRYFPPTNPPPQGKFSKLPLNRSLGGSQGRSGSFGNGETRRLQLSEYERRCSSLYQATPWLLYRLSQLFLLLTKRKYCSMVSCNSPVLCTAAVQQTVKLNI